MKRFLLAAILMMGACVNGQAQGSNYDLAAPGGSYTLGGFPLYYTRLDTIAATGTDTLRLPLRRGWSTSYKNTLNSITYSNDVWKVAGTPTVTVAMYVSANNGASYDATPVTTYTVYPSSTTVAVNKTYLVNNGNGNTYTDYMWVVSGSAASTVSSKSNVLLR